MGKKKSGPRFRASNDAGIATKSTFNPKESRIKALATAADAYGGDEDDCGYPTLGVARCWS